MQRYIEIDDVTNFTGYLTYGFGVGNKILNPSQDGLFRAAHGWGGGIFAPLPKIRHTNPAMIKLGTVIPYYGRSKKCKNHVTHPLGSANISIFSSKISKFSYIKKSTYRLDFDA